MTLMDSAPPPLNETVCEPEANATATATDSASIVPSLVAERLRFPDAPTSAFKRYALTSLAISLRALEIPMPRLPDELVPPLEMDTLTPMALAMISESSTALRVIAPLFERTRAESAALALAGVLRMEELMVLMMSLRANAPEIEPLKAVPPEGAE